MAKHGYAIAGLILGILSVIFSCCYGLGFVLGIVGLVFTIMARKSGNKEGVCTAGLILSIVGVVLGIIMFILTVFVGLTAKDFNITNNEKTTEAVTENISKKDNASSKKESDEKSEKDGGVLRKGGVFEQDGLKMKFVDSKLNYKPSDDEYGFNKPSKGNKYIACTFKFKNNDDSDKYVSIYDFDCYADNKSCNQEFITTEDFKNNDFMNDNLSKGREVTFTTFYQVPKQAKKIQLEYEPNMWSDKKLLIEVK